MQQRVNLWAIAMVSMPLIAVLGCKSNAAKRDPASAEAQALHNDVQATIELAKQRDPGIANWFGTAHGYAVFPGIGAGGFIIGGGHGTGEVYAEHKLIGTADVTQVNIGATVGGQVTRQIIFFKDKFALDRFTKGSFEFDAAASAVAVNSGAATSAAYHDGVAVFVIPKGGAMVQASVGTQKFEFTRR